MDLIIVGPWMFCSNYGDSTNYLNPGLVQNFVGLSRPRLALNQGILGQLELGSL